MNFKKSVPVLKCTFSEFGEDKVLRLSAALAYYAMFSIGPLLVIAVGVAGLVLGHQTVRHQIQQELQSMLGANSAKIVDSMMSARRQGTSLITAIVGIIALLAGAAGVFGQLQDSLNTIWEVKAKPGSGIWTFIRSRFLSFSMVLGVGFLLLVSLALTTFLSAATSSLGNKLPISEALAHILNFVVSFGVITVLFAMIFKYLPDVKIPMRKVWVGAIATAFLFTIGKYLLALYLGRESTTSPYGAAGSVIIILMWVYYASVILFLGAEFTQVYTRQTGTNIVPASYAVPVTQDDRVQQGIPHEEPGYAQASAGAPATEPLSEPAARSPSVGKVIHRQPGPFIGLAFVAAFTAVTLLRVPLLRKVLKLYFWLRKPAGINTSGKITRD